MSFLIDVFVALLLISAIGYGIVLNRKIVALRRDQAGLEKLANSFHNATKRAEDSVKNLKEMVKESAAVLNEGVNESARVRDDLNFLPRFQLCHMSSCAFAARMRHRVHQGSDCVYVCISTTWEVVETNVRFRASRGSRPHRDAWLPICDSSGDAVRTCRKLATRCAYFVVTYEKTPSRCTR